MCRFDRMGPQKIKFVFLKIHLAKMKKNEPMRNQMLLLMLLITIPSFENFPCIWYFKVSYSVN